MDTVAASAYLTALVKDLVASAVSKLICMGKPTP